MDARHIALDRFGLGGRASAIGQSEPKAWLRNQLAHYNPAVAGAESLADRTAVANDLAEYLQQIRQTQVGAPPQGQQTPAQQTDSMRTPKQELRGEMRSFSREQHIAQVGLRVRNAIASDTPFVERLVHFWANHFAVSADRLVTIAFAGLLEFEAIRPHVLGRFEDMVMAVEQHPAMLLYLDQAQSVGPNSFLGTRAQANGRKVGLNENLGREILELHTLGVRTGYSQEDVTEFARALTGWSVAGIGRGRIAERLSGNAQAGAFIFADALHEPGARTIMGKRYAQSGEGQARAVLADLAHHPATARHIATKLARHFVADDPPEALVARLESVFLASGGDLPSLYRVLIDAPEAWAPTPAKFRTPWQWGIAMFRNLYIGHTGVFGDVSDRRFTGIFVELGQPVWRPGSPAGFDDVAASWAAPDALYRRVELAGRVAEKAPADVDPRAIATALYGNELSAGTTQAVAAADSPQQGLALLLVAPEMLRV